MAHHGDATPLVGAGVTEHVAHIGHQLGAVEEGFGDIFCTQRIPRHQHDVGKSTLFGIDMWSWHCVVPYGSR